MKKIRLVQNFGGITALERVSFVGWWMVDGGWWAVYFFSSTLRFRAVHIPELREENPRSARKKSKFRPKITKFSTINEKAHVCSVVSKMVNPRP